MGEIWDNDILYVYDVQYFHGLEMYESGESKNVQNFIILLRYVIHRLHHAYGYP